MKTEWFIAYAYLASGIVMLMRLKYTLL